MVATERACDRAEDTVFQLLVPGELPGGGRSGDHSDGTVDVCVRHEAGVARSSDTGAHAHASGREWTAAEAAVVRCSRCAVTAGS